MVFVPSSPKSETKMHLALSFLDFGDFNTEPIKSRVELVALSTNPQGNRFGYYRGPTPTTAASETTSMKTPLWTHKRVATRHFPPPDEESSNLIISLGVSGQQELFASFINLGSGYRVDKASHGTVVGETRVLSVPDLGLDTKRKAAPLFGVVQHGHITIPLNVVPSPNDILLASAPPLSITPHPPTVHTFPVPPDALAGKLACAIVARKSYIDLVHALRSMPLPAIHDVLVETSRILPPALDSELVRLAVHVHKRANRDEWKTGLDLCHLVAIGLLFDECGEDGAWDLTAVWPLIGCMQWVVDLAERLVRECVFLEGEMLLNAAQQSQKQQVHIKPDPDADPEAIPTPAAPADPNPLLVLLLHPLPVRTLLDILKNIESFREFIAAAKTQSSNAYIARQSLIDIVEISPVNLSELRTALEGILSDVQDLDGASCSV
ncbi:hypothetical protein EXIGLDRAFT_181391 [Exidia glandulosa HHB12029]|uniref:Uncharacterized protein n=1 Tax=Exidia glandulosa HHB12029 TaxID=1314781 RepID=A0A165F2P4_EXIGL|nr:hypothetical protein EXIGLDRAFT_181391 [Exidia glandulosa HHB12029]